MPDPLPSCFGGGVAAAGAPPSSTSVGPSLTTSVYETTLCLIAVSWSRTVLGLSLRLDLFFDDIDHQQQILQFRCRPWLLWKRRGTKSFSISNSSSSSSLLLSWDLSSAKFPATGGPEPSSSFYFAVVLDGNMLLVAGDLTSLAFKRTKAKPLPEIFNPNLVSRREHVLFKTEAATKYETSFSVKEKENKMKVVIDVGDSSLRVLLDGEKLLHVRRIRWKFRGSEIVDSGNGKHVRVSWDLHDWFFPLNSKVDPQTPPPPQLPAGIAGGGERGCAVFTLTFEDEEEEEKKQGYFGKEFEVISVEMIKNSGGYFGRKMKNWSVSSNEDEKNKNKNKKRNSKSLMKTSSSSSSTSSVSSASSSTVMDWASQEDVQLKSVQGFSLVVYAWKN